MIVEILFCRRRVDIQRLQIIVALTTRVGRHYQPGQKALLLGLEVAQTHPRFDVTQLIRRHLTRLINQRYMYLSSLNTVTITVPLQILELDRATIEELIALARLIVVAKLSRQLTLQRLYMVGIQLRQ